MPDTIFIYVDVDDTLVRKVKNREVPIPRVVRHIKKLHGEGAILYCWSNGGEEHARKCAQKLGIDSLFAKFLQKPHVFIDDEKTEDWPCFVHVFPDRLTSLANYKKRLSWKRARAPK